MGGDDGEERQRGREGRQGDRAEDVHVCEGGDVRVRVQDDTAAAVCREDPPTPQYPTPPRTHLVHLLCDALIVCQQLLLSKIPVVGPGLLLKAKAIVFYHFCELGGAAVNKLWTNLNWPACEAMQLLFAVVLWLDVCEGCSITVAAGSVRDTCCIHSDDSNGNSSGRQ